MLLFFFRDDHKILYLQRWVLDFVGTTVEIASAPSNIADRFGGVITDTRADLKDELQRLQQENLFLAGKTQRLASLMAENTRYRTLLNSSRQLEPDLIAAEVTALSPDPARHVVLLDKGSEHGVLAGQPVLGAEGLMGQVILSGVSNSRAVMITDSAHALPVLVNRSGLRALAEGSGSVDRLLIRHLPATSDIRVGDLLVTSGLGGRFPHGYPVAKVTDVTVSDGAAFAEVSATPSSALDQDRFVLILKPNPPEISLE